MKERLEPIREFLHDEAAGAIALLAATLVALVWANSPVADGYRDLWETKVGAGGLELDLRHWVNDGLMAMFFFVVGLEIKRELAIGELTDRRAAALPAIAAVAGVIAPVLVFLAVAGGGDAAAGWAIPAATDIAFAVGVLALLGDRVPDNVRLLLLAVAIVDDIIAIAIIALVYSDGVDVAWLAIAAATLAGVVGLRRAGVWRVLAYVPLGVACWVAVHESGVHATVAGVALGLLTPAGEVSGRDVLGELEHRLHPITAFAIVPLFALANAGVDLGDGVLGDALGSSLAWAIVAGLVIGKLLGITAATVTVHRAGVVRLPDGVSTGHVAGVGALAGIGFTVSLFVASLAFDDPALVDRAKVGILVGSAAAAALGTAIMLAASRPGR